MPKAHEMQDEQVAATGPIQFAKPAGSRHPILGLQQQAGNRVVARLMSARTTGHLSVQRHNMPMPSTLKPGAVAEPRKEWKINTVLGKEEFDKIKSKIATLLPKDSKPSPVERANGLNFKDAKPAEMGSGYESAAARVTPSGEILFNNSHDDYYEASGSFNVDKIKTTAVHESMHFVSANHTGLQNYGDLMSATKGTMTTPLHQPDEAVTDWLSREVYEAVFGSASYVTGYWTPAASKVAAASDAGKKQMALDQVLPSVWTGDMVEILKDVLHLNDEGLRHMYFSEPDKFGALISDDKVRAQLKQRWDQHVGGVALASHGVLGSDMKNVVLEQAIAGKEAELKGQPADKQISIVRSELAARKVPATISPTSKSQTFSDTNIKSALKDKGLLA